MEWRPIETAPKDGRRILVHDYQRPVIARWGETMLRSLDRDVSRDWVDDYGSVLQSVTGWMPLPGSPAQPVEEK